MKQPPDPRRAARRAAAIWFVLGLADLLIVFAGETLQLLLFMIGWYFWVFVAWLAAAVYAGWLSARQPGQTALLGIAALAAVNAALAIAYPGVPLPFGGWAGGFVKDGGAQAAVRMAWVATAAAMVVWSIVVWRRAGKARP
ncbi:MAG: hypothetical protein N2544_16745 [Burkholderiales bacterium]|nr:hypothetical protein [Burkholderiales bacterium]